MTLTEIFKKSTGPIALAISLAAIEKLAWIIEPTLLGRLIDAMIGVFQTREHASFTLPLVLWTGAFLVNTGVASLRRFLDPRIYLKIYVNIAVHIAESLRCKGHASSKAAARTELAREYIHFLRNRVPDFIEQVFDLGGAMFALAFYDIRISLACLASVVPMALISSAYQRHVLRFQKEFHDHREDFFAFVQKQGNDGIRDFHERMVKPQLRIANWGAANFGFLRIVLLGIFLLVLYVVIALDRLSTGEIYSVVAYLWTFIGSAEFSPDLLESYTSLKDIQNRIRSEPTNGPLGNDGSSEAGAGRTVDPS
jgi:ABC-type multidrug transport system fused ATPase/permease subunit